LGIPMRSLYAYNNAIARLHSCSGPGKRFSKSTTVL
jgi:hypothetical protein